MRQFEENIPLKENRPWLWPVNVGGIEYGIPCTSHDTAAGQIGYLRYANNPCGLYLRYMVPVPPKALLPPRPLSTGLKQELEFFEANRKYIEAEVQILRRLTESKQMDRFFLTRSCDYAELESVYFHWQPGYEAGPFSYLEEETNMPVSKNGKTYYTKEQYEAARYNSNALEYARSQGYDLVRQGAYYTMKEHDSMVFTPQGTWFWNSRGVHGNALDFMIYYENKTLTEAVLTLAGEREQARPPERPQPTPAAAPKAEPPRISFRLPDKADNYRLLFSYLCGVRGLEKGVVQEMIRQQRLYQSAYHRPDGKVISNVTFVYRNHEGKAVGAFQRGTYDQKDQPAYKRDVPGSDKRFGWQLPGEGNVTQVAVFEGAIDAASDASLAAARDPGTWRNIDRLSLEGLSFQPLQNYLEAHPNVRQVTLMLDGDEPGRRAAGEIARKLQAKGYQVENREPPFGKDWNEVLLGVRQMEIEARELIVPQPAPVPEGPEL